MKNLLQIALQARGIQKTADRIRTLNNHYGLTASKMDRALAHFGKVLAEYESGATFPIQRV